MKEKELLISIKGNNFSGRTDFLKQLIKQNQESGKSAIFVGEQPHNYLTGISPTLNEEINLHSTLASQDLTKSVESILSTSGLAKKASLNPFTLSGGEQTMLVILSNLLLEPGMLMIDSMTEQLSKEWRTLLLVKIIDAIFCKTSVFIADNRIDEYGFSLKQIVPPGQDTIHTYKFTNPTQEDLTYTNNDGAQNVKLERLDFSYGKNQVFSNFNFTFNSGQIYHLKGQNGAGKTTLAKILTGILKLSKGSIYLDAEKYNPYTYPGKLFGYSFQNPDEQLFASSIEKELLPETEVPTERQNTLMKMFGLESIKNCHPAELPFVMRKRISIAATLAIDRPWYILDEPTLGQDDHFADFLVYLLKLLASQGKGIIVISHSDRFVEKLNCNTVNLITTN